MGLVLDIMGLCFLVSCIILAAEQIYKKVRPKKETHLQGEYYLPSCSTQPYWFEYGQLDSVSFRIVVLPIREYIDTVGVSKFEQLLNTHSKEWCEDIRDGLEVEEIYEYYNLVNDAIKRK